MAKGRYATEADLVAAYCETVAKQNAARLKRMDEQNAKTWPVWTVYHETAGWDLLLVDQHGIQVGIEAKLVLNVKVLTQALPQWDGFEGPDYRAVLVEGVNATSGITTLAQHLGIAVITMSGYEQGRGVYCSSARPDLPDENTSYPDKAWNSWLPGRRCKLPDYIPDVMGGKAAPVSLTQWKVKAIKLLILLERRGVVNRSDMKALDISASRWTQGPWAYLEPNRLLGGYVRCGSTPDLRAQHPRNYAEIEADFEKWAPPDWRTPALI